MTYYADLDVSTIDELPPGRTPILTKLVSDARREEVIGRVREAALTGRQVYWVCPLIEESETLQLQTAVETYETLVAALPELNVGLVHGRLAPAEKAAVMDAFTRNEVQLLVATTVIEVGVDVPNASLMVIEHAERFGLEQFDQLERVIFLQHQGHLRDALDHLFDERGQQVRPDRIDDAQAQRPDQRVFALFGDFLDGERLLENALSLRDDLFADRRDTHFAGAALEDLDVELVFELFDRHRQCRLADETRFGGPAEVPLAGDRDDVFQFGERH
jgi:hypothetical protein